jgi:hypothetical protein
MFAGRQIQSRRGRIMPKPECWVEQKVKKEEGWHDWDLLETL